MDEIPGAPNPSPSGLHGMLADYLIRRSPARLAVDAALLLLLSFVVSHLWTASSDAIAPELRTKPAPTLFKAISRPQTLLGTLYAILFHLGWMLFAWAGLRLVSNAITPRREG